GENVAHGILAKKMVDAVKARFLDQTEQLAIQLACRAQIGAEGLFDHQTPESACRFLEQPRSRQLARDFAEEARRGCQIEQRIARWRSVDGFLDGRIRRRFEKIALDIVQAPGKA